MWIYTVWRTIAITIKCWPSSVSWTCSCWCSCVWTSVIWISTVSVFRSIWFTIAITISCHPNCIGSNWCTWTANTRVNWLWIYTVWRTIAITIKCWPSSVSWTCSCWCSCVWTSVIWISTVSVFRSVWFTIAITISCHPNCIGRIWCGRSSNTWVFCWMHTHWNKIGIIRKKLNNLTKFNCKYLRTTRPSAWVGRCYVINSIIIIYNYFVTSILYS